MRFLQRRSAAEQQVPLEELQAKLRDLHASIQASISEEVCGRTLLACRGVTSGTGCQAVQKLLSKSAQLPLLGSLPCPSLSTATSAGRPASLPRAICCTFLPTWGLAVHRHGSLR